MAPEHPEGTRGPVCWRLYLSLVTCIQTQVGKVTLLRDLQAAATSTGKTLNRWWSQLPVKHRPPNATW